MKQRVISAIIALIIVIPLVVLGGYPYYIGVGLLSLIGFMEMIKVRNRKNIIPNINVAISLIGYVLLVVFSVVNSTSFLIDYRLLVIVFLLCFVPLIINNKGKYDVDDAFFLVASIIFLGVSFRYLIVVRNLNIHYLIYILLTTIMSDTFAHFFGTKIGRVKLCPNVSPNKTVEGMIGGTIFGTFIPTVYFLTFISQSANVFLTIVMSLTLSLIAQFGDLVFSAIKRKYGVKDYGNIMPGHGGVLDRLDSTIFAILAFAFFASFF